MLRGDARTAVEPACVSISRSLDQCLPMGFQDVPGSLDPVPEDGPNITVHSPLPPDNDHQ